jgi:hypothetical protein
MRITTWIVKRDPEKQAAMNEKIGHAREYFQEVINEFMEHHKK